MSDWNERVGILDRSNGMVTVGYHCSRCEVYWQMTMTLDDYSEARMKTETCYACSLRKRLASEIRHSRGTHRLAVQFISSMENQIAILTNVQANNDFLLQSAGRIVAQQDQVIRDLKKQMLDKTHQVE